MAAPINELLELAENDPHVARVTVHLPSGDTGSPVSESPFLGYSNHYVIWECAEHPFTITFEKPKPVIGPPALASEVAGGKQVVVAKLRWNAHTKELHEYKYSLTIGDGDHLRIWDPSGEVDPDPDAGDLRKV